MPTAQQQLINVTWIPGGGFLMGSAGLYPEERPVYRATVGGFWIDTGPVRLLRPPRADGGRPLLRAASSARGGTGAAGAQGDQGRLSSMRAQLLPALPARCPPGGGDRHLNVSPGLLVRRPERVARREPGMQRLKKSVLLLLVTLAAGLAVTGCGSSVSSAIRNLAPSASVSVPSAPPATASPSPEPTTQPSVATPTTAPSAAQTTTAPEPVVTPGGSPASGHMPKPAPAWLWWLVGAVVVLGAIVVVWILRSVAKGRAAAASGWRSGVIDAYAKGSALYDAMSFAERPGALDAADGGARWADIQRRADDLAQSLYAMREGAPNEDERARVADALGSLQAVRSAMEAERAPGGSGAGQAEAVWGRLVGFQAALRALRPPDTAPA
jgi:hypothetical protein